MAIHYFTEDIQIFISNKRLLKSWIQCIIVKYGYSVGEINYIFTSDRNILMINRKYLNHNYFTDIITFSYNCDKLTSGDIYISIDTVKENSERFKTTFINELHRVMIHGILHLVGLNDSTKGEKIQMSSAEDSALEELYTKFIPNN